MIGIKHEIDVYNDKIIFKIDGEEKLCLDPIHYKSDTSNDRFKLIDECRRMLSNRYSDYYTGGFTKIEQDTLDAMRYCFEDLEITRKGVKLMEDYNRMVRGSWKTEIKNVIFNGPATIVFWSDNTKTIVKCSEGDEFDEEKGLAMAIVKKLYGPTKDLKKWLSEDRLPKPEFDTDNYTNDFSKRVEEDNKPLEDMTLRELVHKKYEDPKNAFNYVGISSEEILKNINDAFTKLGRSNTMTNFMGE